MPGKHGPHGELFFFLIQKEPAAMPGSETSSPFFTADIRTSSFSAEVLKKCALIGMHLRAEEERGGKGVGQTPDLGRRVEDEVWSEDESVSSGVSRENSVHNGAPHVIGLYGPGGKMSLSILEGLGVTARQALISPWPDKTSPMLHFNANTTIILKERGMLDPTFSTSTYTDARTETNITAFFFPVDFCVCAGNTVR